MNSDSPERNVSNGDISPDAVGTSNSSRFDRGEAALIVLLLSLVVAGNVATRWLPEGKLHTITVRRGEESAGLGPVDWSAPPTVRKLPPRDLNEAKLSELIDLPGIGPSLATSILDYRERNGRFESVDELDRVSGIGPRKLEVLNEHLFVVPNENPSSLGSPTVDETTKEGGSPTSETAQHPERATPNLNAMDANELMEIPGIGEAFARRIIERRTELGGFRKWAEVDSVPGVGSKRLENIRKHATIR